MSGRPNSPKTTRILTCALDHPDWSPIQIARHLRVPYPTVYSVLRRYSDRTPQAIQKKGQ